MTHAQPSRTLLVTAGIAYLLNILVGGYAASVVMGAGGSADAANLVAAVLYIVVTLCLYPLFAPTNRPVALIAALFSLGGCAISIAATLGQGIGINPLPIFGVYCMLTGWLIVGSRVVPTWIGVALAIGGIGWLTFALPSVSALLVPYNMLPAILAESALAIALLIRGARPVRA